MATAPQFLAPDGQLYSNYIFTTNIAARSFTGTMSADTVDMQVSVRGSGFTSDPDMIIFEGTTFTIPNPAAYPAGLQLFPGNNIIEVKATLTSGAVTNSALTNAILSLETDIRTDINPPTGIYAERYDQKVKIIVDEVDSSYVIGYNFYASISPGGGATGYSKINPTAISSGNMVEITASLGSLSVDANIVKNANGGPVSTPYYLQFREDQVTNIGTVTQTDLNQLFDVPQDVDKVRTNISVDSVAQLQQFSFIHDRRSTFNSSVNPAIPNSEFLAIPTTDPLYYVATAIYLIDNQEFESYFSPEVAVAPLIVTPAIRNIPVVSRDQIAQDMSLAIYRSHPEVDLKPGSVIRDTVIDPFATEAERIRFLISFMQSAQSFTTLLAIDDPSYTGISIPVAQSPYKIALKQALFLKNDTDVQNLIDNIFDQLAATRGTTREPGFRARGEVTAYMTTKPNSPRFISIGTQVLGGSMSFRTTSSATITATGGSTIYNPVTGRYSATLYIEADEAGLAGNLAEGQITNIVNGPPGIQIVNEARTFGGTDLESNLALATRADGILSSVDSGTYRGYVQNTNEVAGVKQTYVVEAGNPLMQRDLNPDTGKHTGGKVDIWIRGDNTATLEDTFAFSFEIVKNGQFEPVGAPSQLQFKAINANITDNNPIIEMLNYPSWGWDFKDTTTGHTFNLTNVRIIPPDTIQLDATLNDPAQIHYYDLYVGSYRFRTSNKYVFNRQPANSILSLTGTVTGTLPSSLYNLYQGSLPLELGRSVESGNYVQITQPLGSSYTIPSSTPITVTGEEHVFLFQTEYLNNLGANPLTVNVWDRTRTIQYNGPYTPTSLVTPTNPIDFTFVDEHGEYPLGLKLTADTRIVEGEYLVVNYSYDENFVVEYTVNSLVSVVQENIENTRNITADVLAKEGIEFGVDISATIAIYGNYAVSTVDSNVRTNLNRLFSSYVLGQPIRQSDIIEAIDATEGVSYVVVPLTKMAVADGALIPQETITTDQTTDYFKVTDWSDTSTYSDVYLLLEQLSCGTLNSGGYVYDPRGVFYNENLLTNLDTMPDAYGVPLVNAPYITFIIGNGGMIIPGYSDDTTLKTKYPFATDREIVDKRIEITSRRVLVSLPKNTTPLDALWWVSYVVYADTGVKNIEPGSLGYVTINNLEFTYAADTETTLTRYI